LSGQTLSARKNCPMDNVARPASGENFEGVIRIEEEKIRSHVGEVVRETVAQTLNGLLQADADELCGAKRYARFARAARHAGRALRPQVADLGTGEKPLIIQVGATGFEPSAKKRLVCQG
jgi:hypothetical protein